jgi:uncharacterized Zn-binding protein involved in type VI secretion
MAPPAARIGDMHTCPMVNPGPVPHVGGPILPPCAVTVITGGRPQARVGDMAVCVGPLDVIAKGSATVIVSGMPAARLGDSTAHGGVIVVGFPTVIIGDAGGGGGGKGAAGAALEGGGSFVQPAVQAKALIAAAKDGTPFCERCNAMVAAKITKSIKSTARTVGRSTPNPKISAPHLAYPASKANVDKMLEQLKLNAVPPYDKNGKRQYGEGYCARHVANAIESSGVNLGSRPKNAKDFGQNLADAGFRNAHVDTSYASRPELWKKGDVIIIQGVGEFGSKTYPGHMAMFDGQYWVSDFVQDSASGIWAGPTFKKAQPLFQVYRP